MRGRSWSSPGILALSALAAACSSSSSGEPAGEDTPVAAAVTCAPATERSIEDVASLRGVVAPPPRAAAVLSSVVAGRVTEVKVEVGDVVTAGQIVARVEDPALPAGSAEGRADIIAAQAEVTAADSAQKRMEGLAAQGVSSRQELEDAVARAATARAHLAAARARASGAGSLAARATLRAPRAGTVLRVFRRGGETVDGTPATPILEIADVSTLELSADAAAADLVRLAAGARATITLDAVPGVAVTGTVIVVAPAVDPATALGQVRIALDPAPDTRLIVGLTGSARVALAAHDGVVVPLAALRRGPSGGDEVVVCEGARGSATAKVTEVTIGVRLADAAEIVEGITADDRIVVDHALGIEDDQPLTEADALGGEPPAKNTAGATK